MAIEANRRGRLSWVWQYFRKLNESDAKCSLCVKTLQYHPTLNDLKSHLSCVHDISNEQNELKTWRDESILLWRYFTEDENLHRATCKCCCRVIIKEQHNLQHHLQHWHSNVIDIIYEELKCSWVSLHFTFDLRKCDMKCIHCEWRFKIFVEIDRLKSHLFQCHKINKSSGNHKGINDNNRNIMIQQSVAEENYATNSHHDNRHEQNAGNQIVQQRDNTNKDSSISSEDDNHDTASAMWQPWK